MTTDQQPPFGANIDTLPGDATGSWLVTTESSSYLLDLTGRTATRYPGAGSDTVSTSIAGLRRDADAIPLLGVTCTVGKPMVLTLDLRGDDILTVRMTTIVRNLEPVAAPETLPGL